MPKKRELEVRLREAEDRLEQLRLEKDIRDLKNKRRRK